MIDFHCHLDLYPDPHGVAAECARRGLTILSVTTTPSAYRGTAALATRETIRTALGLHPELAKERLGELALFESLIKETGFVGEVGLDGSARFRRFWADQLQVFERVIQLAEKNGGRILSIHSRAAASAVLDVLSKYPGAGVPVMHWFSGTPAELRRAVSMGCWFSVGPGMTSGSKGKTLIAGMPEERVVIESDGPFVQKSGRPVLPWELDEVTQVLGEMWKESAASELVCENGRRLLNSAKL